MLYYVNDNAQSTWEHEVHKTWCSYLPLIVSKTPLWSFDSCWPAKARAKTIYANSDWCAYCCPNCHTR